MCDLGSRFKARIYDLLSLEPITPSEVAVREAHEILAMCNG